jgi:hypothetical protein
VVRRAAAGVDLCAIGAGVFLCNAVRVGSDAKSLHVYEKETGTDIPDFRRYGFCSQWHEVGEVDTISRQAMITL